MQTSPAAPSSIQSLYTGSIKRAAFLDYPHAGGTYSVYSSLREALAPLGVTLEWVGVCELEVLRRDPHFEPELSRGRAVDEWGQPENKILGKLLTTIQDGQYDLVFINVLTSRPEMSVAAYLPPHIRRVMIVHSITPGTYSAAKAVAPYVHAIVGVSPRVQQELTSKLHKPPASIFCAPNALDFKPYANISRPPRNSAFRLLSLGRIVDADKGVFWLPQILQRLSDIAVHLTIVGDGPNLPDLKQRFAAIADRVTFIGWVAHKDVPAISARHDAILLPSRFEGFGYTLIEAMAAGCVPVASKISGTTDFVVKHETTGLLFPIGDTVAAAASVRRLATDTALWARFSAAGTVDVQYRFSTEALTRNYLPILESIENLRKIPTLNAHSPTILPIGGGWRRYVPVWLKNRLRNYLHR